jgi:pyruvate ferredoxin oxidoreductase alpha subunit
MPSREDVDAFLPSYNPLFTLHPDKPVTIGAYAMPELYTEAKFAQETAIRNSKKVIDEVMEESGKRFGRSYKSVETYNCDGADFVFIAIGSLCENIKTCIDDMKDDGRKQGLLKCVFFVLFLKTISSKLLRARNVLPLWKEQCPEELPMALSSMRLLPSFILMA